MRLDSRVVYLKPLDAEDTTFSLRAYWSIVDADFFEPDKWGIRDVDTAGGELKKLPHWDEFMNQVGFRGPIETILPIDPKLGVFSNTWYQIQQILSSKPSADQESNVDFSPAVTRLRSRLDKQSKVASDIFTGSPAHSPTRLTRRLQEISLGRLEQEEVGEASADNATWDFDNTSSPPYDIKKDPTFKVQETFPPVSDETLVNAFIISLAAAVTFSTPGVKALWSLERKGYTVGIGNDTKIFTARTDGHLSLQHQTYSKIIVEVKAMTRESLARIRMQEVAEMAAWIHAEPDIIPEGMSNIPLRDIWFRHMMLCCDRHEVYLVFADYNADYIDYITNATRESSCQSFLVMNEFGPWNITVPVDIEKIASVLLAVMLQFSKEQSLYDVVPIWSDS
ncbi:hypothetical protein BDV33DRAFT_197125 [Aspergillus novoparasiticus]|uniref:Uncharacterized protein n=1 Tax=Aspergillus novoparasiticus TaxID=986946 RepID=A0A5N6E9G0_9EURO|nr:hypothetical protein BDV33DRAFT_197125 [Aspergillus novoparasiticus]